MSDQFVNQARDRMGTIERLLKGLPGIRGYVDKDLRREADRRLRETLVDQMEEGKQQLFAAQLRLLEGNGLLWMDNVDTAVQKLQILIDRVKTAASGYAGLFDAVRIREDELDALYRFDVALVERVVDLRAAILALATAVESDGDIGGGVRRLIDLLSELNTLFGRRQDAVLDPELLSRPDYLPQIDPAPGNPDS